MSSRMRGTERPPGRVVHHCKDVPLGRLYGVAKMLGHTAMRNGLFLFFRNIGPDDLGFLHGKVGRIQALKLG
jgi:hypothetical protein